jgi:signal transduction histidine kinase
MELKKSHFPIFILGCVLALVVSCQNEKENQGVPNAADYSKFLQKGESSAAGQRNDSAFYYFNLSKNIGKEIKDSDKIVYSLIRMSGLQQMQGDFSGSEASATEALDYLQKANPVYSIAVYNALGMALKDLSDYQNAIRYYNYSLKLSNDPLERAIIKNNIAVVYMENQKYKAAIGILRPLFSQKEVLANPETNARVLDNLGYAYYKTESAAALTYLEKSLKIRETIADDYGIVASYHHLSDYYANVNSDKAKKYGLLAYQTATKINSAEDRLETLGQLIKNSPKDQVKKYSLIHIKLNDSLNLARQKAKNQFAKIKYDDAKTKEENTNLKLQNEHTENTNNLFKLSGVCAVLILGLLYRVWNEKHRKEKQEQVTKTEKAISKKIHDELANDLYNAMTFASGKNLADKDNRNFLLRQLNNIYRLTRDISHQTDDVEVGQEYLPSLLGMINIYNDAETSITIRGIENLPLGKISDIKKRTIYRLIQELLINMKKHSQASLVFFDFSIKDKSIVITYKDNGVGLHNDKLILKKALQNVENHIQGINGAVIFDEVSGKLNISFPIK